MNNDNLLTYDIAVSFAGEDREYVEKIAKVIQLKGMTVFYDRYEEADLWGKDLYVHLTEVYRDNSKFCLMFISKNYEKKQWTNHERRAAQARAFRENQEYILPLRLDDTDIDGILETTGYADSRYKSIEEIVNMLRVKITDYNQRNGIKAEIINAESVFEKAGIQMQNGQKVKDSMMETSCPSCGERQFLSEAYLSLKGEDTAYECKNGCQIIAVVSRPGLNTWQGRGYRLKDFVLRNAKDITLKLNSGGQDVLIPASPAALMKQQPKSS